MKTVYILSLCGFSVLAGPIVTIQGLGQIEGREWLTKNLKIKAHGFFRIPYAAPPIGDLRFKKPQQVLPWSGVLNGTKWGPGCVPHVKAGAYKEYSQDCLTMNLIKRADMPENVKQENPNGLPVVIYFPGGGFQTGSMAFYSEQGYADIWATQNVIVVTAQYRLGPYGFLSTGDSRIPGNLGIWDQVQALRFLNEHIADFGGDPSRITVWGLSSTGCSVGLLTLTPKANPLFLRTIEQSGSPFSNWPQGTTVVQNSREYITAIGCDPAASASLLKKCLRSKTEEESMRAVDEIGFATDDFAWLKFGPVIDGDLFTASPHVLIKKAPPKKSIQGVARNDGGFFCEFEDLNLGGNCERVIFNFRDFNVRPIIDLCKTNCALATGGNTVNKWSINDKLSTWGEKDLTDAINRLFRQPQLYGNRSDEATNKIINYYVNEERGQGPRDNAFYLDRYNQFFTDIMWHVPHADGVKIKTAWNWPIYVYSMDHYNDGGYSLLNMSSIPQRARGPYHDIEMHYTMGVPFYGTYDISSPAEVKVTKTLQKTFINFVKHGSPFGADNSSWPPSNSTHLGHFSITGTPLYNIGFYDETWKFWDDMRTEYGFDVITLTPTIKWELPEYLNKHRISQTKKLQFLF